MVELSTKPYLIRAIYEWCADCGYTPYLSVRVDENTRVPMEYVKDGEIVLNVGHGASRNLTIANDIIQFSARFNGVSREIAVPTYTVQGIFARETGKGAFFELEEMPEQFSEGAAKLNAKPDAKPDTKADAKPGLRLASVSKFTALNSAPLNETNDDNAADNALASVPLSGNAATNTQANSIRTMRSVPSLPSAPAATNAPAVTSTGNKLAIDKGATPKLTVEKPIKKLASLHAAPMPAPAVLAPAPAVLTPAPATPTVPADEPPDDSTPPTGSNGGGKNNGQKNTGGKNSGGKKSGLRVIK